jgi:2-keto-4-pentenoate hydratase/2-oxohepta-3-ene-1,7-dioic acid hydratase in catechol pathway
MKFVTFIYKEKKSVGLVNVEKNEIVDLHEASGGRLPRNLVECLELGNDFVQISQQILDQWQSQNIYKIDDVQIIAPIQTPRKHVLCIGKNYVEHALELGTAADIPEHPLVFTKPPTAIIGPGENIQLHENVTDALDYEGELAVVIGKEGKAITEEEAMDYVFGYSIINDITARDLQAKHKQFFMGKSLDTTCPLGPYVVYKDIVTDPHNLQIETKVNGEIRQSSNTNKMIFNIPTLISILSQGMTLQPGDMIATGTPAGVGKGFKPPRYLKHGDEIEISIEKIGTLKNQVLS